MTTKRTEPERDNSTLQQEEEPATKKEKKNDQDVKCDSVTEEEKIMTNDINVTPTPTTEQQHIILFYKYHRLSPCHEKMESFRLALENLCRSLNLTGRILIGCSHNEGINGTLAGRKENVRAFTYALLGRDFVEQKQKNPSNNRGEKGTDTVLEQNLRPILDVFWKENEQFAQSIDSIPLIMASPDDFKWSKSTSTQPLFPDLNIKLVKEIIGTGGCLEQIPLDETSQGYLTPKEWHNQLKGISSSKSDTGIEDKEDTVLIDCRNTKECSIGTFPNAIDPGTTTFSQFPLWVQNNRHRLAGKKVMMYCTGGIRCEKASAYIRNTVDGVQSVNHLKGGIHKYLEEYGNEGLWQGKNFVFDGRGAADAIETKLGKDDSVQTQEGDSAVTDVNKNSTIVGRCLYCDGPYDTFHPGCVCTVCREPTLVCDTCRSDKLEFHCKSHTHLRSCYFTNLIPFTAVELQKQLEELDSHLDSILVGRKFKQKRKTLQKQYSKIQERLAQLRNSGSNNSEIGEEIQNSTFCRNCGDSKCSGSCWGFHGLKRKEVLEEKASGTADTNTKQKEQAGKDTKQRPARQKSNQRLSKQIERERMLEEIRRLRLSLPPSEYRNAESGVRIPPPCTRVIQTTAKGKWCGKPIRQVLQNEFANLSNDKTFDDLVELGLLRVNGVPLSEKTESQEIKNMDVISRIVHWHEPPVVVGDEIPVQKIQIPTNVLKEYHIESSSHTSTNEDFAVYVCNKPSTLPVHPAGPYLANTLTMMIEAQEKLEPRSLTPCHRIDRVTSGLTLCCTNVGIARLIQSKIDEGSVEKLYLAKVQGNFIASEDSANMRLPENSKFAHWSWQKDTDCVLVDAPVHTLDAQNGIREVSPQGKPSRSRFQFLAYDNKENTSLIACCPLTGRGHQLRVHLKWLGFPIANDTQYGGLPEKCEYNRDAILSQMMSSLESESNRDDSAEKTTIAHDDVEAAKTACRCCQQGKDGFVESFTPAQLLERGHSICLHALRYKIPIFLKKNKSKDPDEKPAPLATIEAEVDLPGWAECFGPIGPLPCLH